MDNAPLPPLPSFASDKARALAGLTPEERQDLLAAAGALGLANDHDPFWINQAFLTQLKTLLAAARSDMAETREIATDAMAEARAVAKQLRPSADLAAQHIKSTVETVQANLTDKTAAAIAKVIAVEVRRRLQDREAAELSTAKIGGAVAVSIGLAMAFAFGVTCGRNGWGLGDLPGSIGSAGVGTLLIGQAVIMAAAGWWFFKDRR